MSYRLALLSLGFITPFASGIAGVGSSGGGVAVVCREGTKIERAELLDLYEGRVLYGIRFFESSASTEVDYAIARERVVDLMGGGTPPSRASSIRAAKDFIDYVRFTRAGERLPWMGDIGRSVRPPEGCDFEQVAIYDDVTYSITVDSEIYSALPPMSRAALIAHEYYYSSERAFHGVHSSQYTRSLVAQSFSAPGSLPNPTDGLAPGSFECVAGPGGPTEFSVTNEIVDGQPLVTLTFTAISGRVVLARTRAKFRGLRWNMPRGTKDMVADPTGGFSRYRGYLDAPYSPEIAIDLVYEPGKPVRFSLMDAGGVLVEQSVSFCR